MSIEIRGRPYEIVSIEESIIMGTEEMPYAQGDFEMAPYVSYMRS
jgi:hypothetical protein